jgi:competence protein ComEC
VLLSLAMPDALHPLTDLSLQFAALSVGWLEKLIAVAARPSYASIQVAALEDFAWLLLLVPLVWVLLPPGWPGRHIAWLGAVVLMLWRPAGPPERCVDIRALDVGQGLAFVLRTRDRTLVYAVDCKAEHPVQRGYGLVVEWRPVFDSASAASCKTGGQCGIVRAAGGGG